MGEEEEAWKGARDRPGATRKTDNRGVKDIGTEGLQCGERSVQEGKHSLTLVSAGFATVHGNNTLTINAVEAYPLDKFSAEVCPSPFFRGRN